MSKTFTEADFTDQITSDRTWRLREISDLKSAVGRADNAMRRVLLRSLVTICYAHWEGYIRFSARRYLEHIALRRFSYSELDRQFLRNYFLPRLGALATNKGSFVERCRVVDDILTVGDRRFSKVNEDLVNTKSNLNFAVFEEICLICGVSAQFFESSATFIDVLLLKRRNAIAHGEDSFVEVADLDQLTTETTALMRTFGDALENNIYEKKYRAALAAA